MSKPNIEIMVLFVWHHKIIQENMYHQKRWWANNLTLKLQPNKIKSKKATFVKPSLKTMYHYTKQIWYTSSELKNKYQYFKSLCTHHPLPISISFFSLKRKSSLKRTHFQSTDDTHKETALQLSHKIVSGGGSRPRRLVWSSI